MNEDDCVVLGREVTRRRRISGSAQEKVRTIGDEESKISKGCWIGLSSGSMHPYRRLRVAMASAPGTAACAACRVLRRKCTAQCLFAPYFPPDQPQKFAHVHKVFGVANVTKMLHELPPPHREDCVNSLAYEADARVQDPVYGCVGAISVLQQQVAHLQAQLSLATSEISRLRETFAIAAAASNHNNNGVSGNNNTTANGNGNAATAGGNLFMSALQPSSRSSPPHCSNGITNSTISLDQESSQELLRPGSNGNGINTNCTKQNNTDNENGMTLVPASRPA